MNVAEELKKISDFAGLLPFLEKHMGWPIKKDELYKDDPVDRLTYEFKLKELGIDPKKTPGIREIRQLIRFHDNQPFGIFFVNFDHKKLKVTALRRILRALGQTKRESANDNEYRRWSTGDLLFISNFGEADHRQMTMAHFQENADSKKIPTLQIIDWDEYDTLTRLKVQANALITKLHYPEDESDAEAWREQWTNAPWRELGKTIKDTKEIVTELARLATNTRERIKILMDYEFANGPLHKIMNSFKEAIFPNLTVETFADMYAQTVAYGLFQKSISPESVREIFDDVANLKNFTNPFLLELFKSFSSFGPDESEIDYDEIGLKDVEDLLTNKNISQVLADFRSKRPGQDPSILLYEDFLNKYDPDSRKNHGVFYTPKEVVKFIVQSVHETLQNDFKLKDGLADTTTWAEFAKKHQGVVIPEGWDDKPFVQILDPSAGTGTFLLTVIDVIHKHLKKKWDKQGKSEECESLWQDYVPKHLLPRLYGFELMMAPYAMAHLSIMLLLNESGYTPQKDERLQLYLTNTLSKPFDFTTQFSFMTQALTEEGRGANRIKKEVPITVILGNPPYSGHSMNNSLKEIKQSIREYTAEFPDLRKPGQGKWLQDDYVKFIRWGELALLKQSYSVLSFITNHAYQDNPTFKGMRKSLSQIFSKLSILDLHGSLRKKEISPNGGVDQNVFDIQQGVAVLQGVRFGIATMPEIRIGDLWGSRSNKLSILSNSTISKYATASLQMRPPLYMFKIRDSKIEEEYSNYPSIAEIMGRNGDPAPGIVTTHDEFAISWTPDDAIKKVEVLISTDDEEEARQHFRLCKTSQWSYLTAKNYLSKNNVENKIIDIQYRLFDFRHTIFDSHVAVHLRKRVMKHMIKEDNIGLITVRQMSAIGQDWQHAFVSSKIIDICAISNRGKEVNYIFPLKLTSDGKLGAEVIPNISKEFLDCITSSTSMAFQQLIEHPPEQEQFNVVPKKPTQENLIELEQNERGDMTATFGCRDVFDYIYTILHSPTYRKRYIDYLKYAIPRVPLPSSASIFKALVPLGKELVALHLLDENHPKLKTPSIVFRGQGDNRVSYKKGQIKWDNGKMPINPDQWFQDIPEDSVDFSIGGFTPLKKWLHDRAATGGTNPREGRILSEEDILHYRRMVVAITETPLVMKKIDEVIDAHGGWPGAFKSD